MAFTFSLGVKPRQGSVPLVVDDNMFVLTPYPNILYALDLTQPGARAKWQYEPKPDASGSTTPC